ncbi:hypothetical protein IWW48_002652 [Coemansia sp. RSA 1200]|nr:hypothetical protein IWW48_002652 [Coemansia sp. RSA 1200]
MERAPSRAKATNILRPASRAQTPAYTNNETLAATTAALGGISSPSGPRFVVPTAGASVGAGGIVSSGTPGVLRRPPSTTQFFGQQLDQAHHAGIAAVDQQQQQQQQMRNGGSVARQRVSSYYENPMPIADPLAPGRSLSRSGSRAELVPGQGMPLQHQGQQQPPRSSSRAGRPGIGGAPMWAGAIPGQMGINGLFGGGFGSMGGDFGPISPMTPRQQQPARPATSTGFRSPNADGDSPVVVNVARGGARVIGPMRAKPTSAEAPSFLNPIPQSPSSVLGARIPGESVLDNDAMHAANPRSALSNSSVDSARSRSNSALQPTEEFMEAAEARVSRKIQDLEISNKSLLAINSQLESRVKSQREHISELKKQLQMKMPFISEPLVDNEISDEDAKAALEYRSTIAAGKVISAAELNEDDSQLTIGKNAGNELVQKQDNEASSSSSKPCDADNDESEDGREKETNIENDGGNNNDAEDNNSEGPLPIDGAEDVAKSADKSSSSNDEKTQEARELVARLMVLALASSESANPSKANSRIPKRSGSASATAQASSRPTSALKVGLRAPVKSTSMRISSFGVASESTPVRSLIASPTPLSKSSSVGGKEPSSASEKDQILEICRKLQDIL